MTARRLTPKSIYRVGCFGLTRLIRPDSGALKCEHIRSHLFRCVQEWTELGSHLGACIQKWMELGGVMSHLPERFSQSRNSGFADQSGNSRFASHSARNTPYRWDFPTLSQFCCTAELRRLGIGASGPGGGNFKGGLVLQNDTPAKTWLSSMPFIHLKSEDRTSRQNHPIHPQCEDEA